MFNRLFKVNIKGMVKSKCQRNICGEIANPKVCAIVREDMVCLLEHLKETNETIAVKVIKKTRKDLLHS